MSTILTRLFRWRSWNKPECGDYAQVIRGRRAELERSIDVNSELTNRLANIQYVADKTTVIEHGESDNHKARILLEVLLEVPCKMQSTVFRDVLNAFLHCGQEHVAEVFISGAGTSLMTGERYRLLENSMHAIGECLDTENGLLDELCCHKRVFSCDDRQRIELRPDSKSKAEQCVRILQRKPNSAFDDFISALEDTRQSHVAYILTGRGVPPMSRANVETLTTNRMNLVQTMVAKGGLADWLESKGVFTTTDRKKIDSCKTEDDAARMLLDLLRRKPDEAFHHFVRLLNENGQSHVVYILTGSGEKPLLPVYRKVLNEKRNVLVADMDSTTTSLVANLVSKAVLNDFERQKVETEVTNRARNEIILNILLRKSQPAFERFVLALIESDQEHMTLCLVGIDIRGTIRSEFSGDTSASGAQRVKSELVASLQACTQDALGRVLEKMGISLSDASLGSIRIRFRCRSLSALENLRQLLESGDLSRMYGDVYVPMFADQGLRSLRLYIADDEFDRCRRFFDANTLMSPKHREALRAARERPLKLLGDVNVDDALIDKLSLCDHRRRAVLDASSDEERLQTIVDVVSRRPDSDFARLVDALRETGHADAARSLDQLARRSSKRCTTRTSAERTDGGIVCNAEHADACKVRTIDDKTYETPTSEHLQPQQTMQGPARIVQGRLPPVVTVHPRPHKDDSQLLSGGVAAVVGCAMSCQDNAKDASPPALRSGTPTPEPEDRKHLTFGEFRECFVYTLRGLSYFVLSLADFRLIRMQSLPTVESPCSCADPDCLLRANTSTNMHYEKSVRKIAWKWPILLAGSR